jgi:hypothetical protein
LLTSFALHLVLCLEVQRMANRDNPNPNREGQHQGGHPPNRSGEVGGDRDITRDEDMSRKQREGNLGNERNKNTDRIRNKSDEAPRDRLHDANRLPE